MVSSWRWASRQVMLESEISSEDVGILGQVRQSSLQNPRKLTSPLSLSFLCENRWAPPSFSWEFSETTSASSWLVLGASGYCAVWVSLPFVPWQAPLWLCHASSTSSWTFARLADSACGSWHLRYLHCSSGTADGHAVSPRPLAYRVVPALDHPSLEYLRSTEGGAS